MKHHLDYIKELAAAIKIPGMVAGTDYPFTPAVPTVDPQTAENIWPDEDPRFFETLPATDKFEEHIPFMTVVSKPHKNRLDARFNKANRIVKLAPENPTPTTKNNRYVTRHFKIDYPYQLQWWIKTPDSEVLSDITEPGILTQAKLFISKNQLFGYQIDPAESETISASADVADSGVIVDPQGGPLYKVYLDLLIRDGLYEIEKAETLAGATFEIVPPVDVEVVT